MNSMVMTVESRVRTTYGEKSRRSIMEVNVSEEIRCTWGAINNRGKENQFSTKLILIIL